MSQIGLLTAFAPPAVLRAPVAGNHLPVGWWPTTRHSPSDDDQPVFGWVVRRITEFRGGATFHRRHAAPFERPTMAGIEPAHGELAGSLAEVQHGCATS